jgi:hypothetical protein
MKRFLTLFILTILVSCSSRNDPITEKKEVLEPNVFERGKKAAEENPIISLGGRKQKSADIEFSSSNVLWRATLKSLEFLPLSNTDYRGGIIVYDWYSQVDNPKEQIKISIQFLNNELRSDSIKVTAHKKVCDSTDRCSNSTLDQNFANSIKDSIIATARSLKIEEAKKEKK